METDYLEVTETSGSLVSKEQIQRMFNRYDWALPFCRNRDVVEVACGSGQGLGLIGESSKSIVGGDISEELLSMARSHYKDEFDLKVFDASKMPFKDSSKDVVICFEALYYFPNVEAFLSEVDRVLRKGGYLLISSANKDLGDFNPSPFTYKYYGVKELNEVLNKKGFDSVFYGDIDTSNRTLLSQIFSVIKKMIVFLDLMPKTMSGKRLLKRIVFGKLVKMPSDLREILAASNSIVEIDANMADTKHKVVLVAAQKK